MKTPFLAVVVSLALGSVSQGGIVFLDSTQTLDEVLGGSSLAVTGLLTTDMSNGNVLADVLSQAFTGASGMYAYLYQVHNTGLSADTAIEMLTLWPFHGAGNQTAMGYLTGTMPPGFVSDGQSPEEMAFVDAPSDQPVVSFYYTKRFGAEIAPGEHSRVMYVLSSLSSR